MTGLFSDSLHMDVTDEFRGWYFIDFIYLTPSPAPGPHAVTSSLVVPNVLPVTQALFNKLLSRYGTENIFSGQADPSGVTWLEANIGKTPAILGLDMIEYSPTRVVSLPHNKNHITASQLRHA